MNRYLLCALGYNPLKRENNTKINAKPCIIKQTSNDTYKKKNAYKYK